MFLVPRRRRLLTVVLTALGGIVAALAPAEAARGGGGRGRRFRVARMRLARVPRSRGGAWFGRSRAPRNPMTDFRVRQKPDRF